MSADLPAREPICVEQRRLGRPINYCVCHAAALEGDETTPHTQPCCCDACIAVPSQVGVGACPRDCRCDVCCSEAASELASQQW